MPAQNRYEKRSFTERVKLLPPSFCLQLLCVTEKGGFYIALSIQINVEKCQLISGEDYLKHFSKLS